MSLCHFPAAAITLSLADIIGIPSLPTVPTLPTLAALSLPCPADKF